MPYDFNPFLDMLAGAAVQPYSNEPGRGLSAAPAKMVGGLLGAPGFAKDMVQGSINSAVRGVKTAHKAWPGLLGGEGSFDPNDPEDFAGAQDLAGLMSGGALPFTRPEGSLAAGAARVAKGAKAAKAAPAAPEAAGGLLGRTAYGPEQDLLFNGKAPKDFTPGDWGAFGQAHGVPNLGPESDEAFHASLVPYQDTKGRTFTVPGGIEDTNKPFTYFDLLHLKAQGINPNDLHPDVHRQLHNRIMTTMSPEGPVSDERLFNQYLMGITSPNNGLTNNEFAVGAMMAKEGDDSIGRMAGMTPWKTLDDMPPANAEGLARRLDVSGNITSAYGLQEGARGGMGNSGSQDYTRISDLAKMFKENPDWFRFRGAGEGGSTPSEQWLNLVNRVSSQVAGLKPKTASFSTVWQNPRDAAISAIDRHMATELDGALFTNPEEQKAFEQKVVNYFNLNRPKEKQLSSYQDVMNSPGGRSAFVEQAMQEVNKHGDPVFRTKKGDINPNIPEPYKKEQWIREPKKVNTLSPGYIRALTENDRLARLNNQGLFANQWMLWDRIRKRIEPHEVMFPGLEKLPRMSHRQISDAFDLHTNLGYQKAPKTVLETSNPSGMAYFTIGGGNIPMGLLSQQSDQ